jgi:hypothetical protein
MATSQYTYHPYHTIGAATMLLWDGAAGDEGAWRHLGKVADAAVLVSTEQVGKDITTKGLTQPVARRNRSKRYSLSFRLLEDTNPLVLDYIGSEGAAQSAEASELVTTSEVVRLYGLDWREVAHPFGIAAEQPEGVTEVLASAGGTGGSIAPGTYYYWVIPKASEFTGEEAPTGSVLVAANEKVTITFTEPTGWSPDEYIVVYNASGEFGSLSVAGTGYSGSPIVLSDHDGGEFTEGGGPLLTVSSYDGLSVFASGTDYTLDVEKGLIKRVAGGGIADGEQVVVGYAYWRPASVSTPLGDAVDLERYRKLRLLQLAPDDPDPANWRETGVEFTFFKVNVNLGDSRWPFSENDFSEGVSFTWDALFDGEEGKVGTVRSTYGVLAEYE